MQLDDSWMGQAACIGMDPDPWFSTEDEAKALAFRVCASCPVQLDCVNYALDAGLNREMDGIWGGFTPSQRRRLRRRRNL